MVFILYNVE